MLFCENVRLYAKLTTRYCGYKITMVTYYVVAAVDQIKLIPTVCTLIVKKMDFRKVLN